MTGNNQLEEAIKALEDMLNGGKCSVVMETIKNLKNSEKEIVVLD